MKIRRDTKLRDQNNRKGDQNNKTIKTMKKNRKNLIKTTEINKKIKINKQKE